MTKRHNIVDGWARLDDDAKLDRATDIALKSIEKVLADVDPALREDILAEWRALPPAERSALIRATLDAEQVELSSMADVKV